MTHKHKLTKRERTKEKKKDKILDFLMNYKIASTGKIASVIKSDKYRANDLLEELYQEKEITRISMPNSTYWELK